MMQSVLVATPYLAFGELLRVSLEENGNYQVSQVETGQQVLTSASQKQYSLAILDSDLADQPIPFLLQTLHAQQPDMRVMVIHPENNQPTAPLIEYKPDAYLNRRFYAPDLLQTVSNILSAPVNSKSDKAATASAFVPGISWQRDNNQAARQLKEMMAGSSALAGLILRSRQLWASAGSIDLTAIQEIAANLAPTLDEAEKGDLARFMRLNANQKEYIVYAAALGDGFTLALVFDPSTPLTATRSQAQRLVNSLRKAIPNHQPAVSTRTVPSPQVASNQAPGQTEEAPISLVELLATMPSPQTVTEGFAVDEWVQASDETIPSSTLPLTSPGVGVLRGLEGIDPCYSRLIYVCLMIPRIPEHLLTGELADHLSRWFSQCCLAFGWRLESIAIRPETVQWTIELSPSSTPASMICTLRQRISQSIFNQYPHLKIENPSGDFWAPGYLILSGSTPPDLLLIRQFMLESRRRQGLVR